MMILVAEGEVGKEGFDHTGHPDEVDDVSFRHGAVQGFEPFADFQVIPVQANAEGFHSSVSI